LRIERSTGLPSKGGYFEKFTKVYKIIVSNVSNPIRSKVLEAHHWPDKDVFIVPDLYANFCIGTYPDPRKDYQHAKKFYLGMLNEANSNRSGCRQYVEDSYYKFPRYCFPNAFMIDSNTIDNNEEVLIRVVIHKSDRNHVDDQCTICIQRIVQNPEWDRCCEKCIALGSLLAMRDPTRIVAVRHVPKSEEECARVNLPYDFDGVMYALGKHVYQYQLSKSYMKYGGTHNFEPDLRVMSECLARQLKSRYHWETLGMRRTLECFDEKVPLCVSGDKGLTKSINCTVNLANSAHYDCNDEGVGVGVGVWFEKEKHLGTEVFL